MRNRKLAGLAALVLSTFAIGAFAQNQKPAASDTELNYQAGSSPMGDVPMYQSMNPKAPKMTQAEFDRARQIHQVEVTK